MASRRGQWPVVAVNGIVAVTVLALVAVLALVVNPPAPPGIAAFAPQASKPITKAPLGQSAQSGEGAGECGEGQVCTGPSARPSASATSALPTTGPSVPPIRRGVPSALQCYTWPDGTVTQTFDPQSPPCVATWDDAKGNGGATSPGVTATEVRIAFPIYSDATFTTWPKLQPIVDFFNTRFQLYGRKIRIVPFVSQQVNGQYDGSKVNDPALQRADASQITQLKVFGTLDFLDVVPYSWSLPVFRDILTKNKIVSISGGASPPYGTEQDLVAHAPYEWSYYPTIDTVMRNVATMTCRQLVGKPAQHAQDPELAGKKRSFALVFPSDAQLGGSVPGLSTLLGILEGCGVRSPELIRYDANDDNQILPQSEKLRQLREAGVTSLIFFPHTGSKGRAAPQTLAERVGYRPEWVTIGWNKYLTDIWSSSPQSQKDGTFGVALWNKMPQLQVEFWYQAFLAAGGIPDDAAVLNNALNFYNELLLLASGIQMAGPNLTPASFAEGLRTTTFPNPGGGTRPYFQATVGFGSGSSSMVQDFAGFWFDPRTTYDTYAPQPALNYHKSNCYVALGRRWSVDSWPATDDFFDGGCR